MCDRLVIMDLGQILVEGSPDELVQEQAPALGVSLVIAELFYRFHSFILETMAFLGTWYAVDRAINRVRR